MMDLLYPVFLALHIAAGSTALLAGTTAMVSGKGNRRHRTGGRIFYHAMNVTAVSALILSLIHPSLFLFCIGIFSFYQNFAGYRAVRRKSVKAERVDFIVLSLSILNTAVMLVSGYLILVVFGGISTLIVLRHIRAQVHIKKSGEQASAWIRMHIGMMIGAFISAVTAFLVVNIKLSAGPSWLPLLLWLTPTIILVPLMSVYNRRYAEEPK